MKHDRTRSLIPDRTCWRIERANRLAVIVDAAEYFWLAKAAMLKARHRIMLIGWDFDTRIKFEPERQELEGPNLWDNSSRGCRSIARGCRSMCSSGILASSRRLGAG
jgi:hypothetical protein